jgi:hypothetical protein
MAQFADLAPCSYFGKWENELLAVGWLESGSEFRRGAVDPSVFSSLVRLCANPWQPLVVMGRQPCPFCRFTGGPGQISFEGTQVQMGSANLFVPGTEKVFVAPTMVVHYIDAHEYAPPVEFQEAVLRCPPMRSFEYLKQMKARGMVTPTVPAG